MRRTRWASWLTRYAAVGAQRQARVLTTAAEQRAADADADPECASTTNEFEQDLDGDLAARLLAYPNSIFPGKLFGGGRS